MAEQIRTLDIEDDESVDVRRGRSFWETLQECDPTGTAADLGVPTLFVQGGRDYLVTIEDDLPIWEAEIGDEPNVDIEICEELNHRFQPGDEPENPVDGDVVDRVAAFVLAGE